MANLIKLKRSAVANKRPTIADLELGELAINTFDGKIFLKKNNGTEEIVLVNPDNSSYLPSLVKTFAFMGV